MMYDEVLALMFSFAASYSPYRGRLTATKLSPITRTTSSLFVA
jgi:hypothetical protein